MSAYGWWRIGVGKASWWWRNERGSTNINRDAVDVDFKLRSTSKIAVGINTYMPDNKIKSCLILRIL